MGRKLGIRGFAVVFAATFAGIAGSAHATEIKFTFDTGVQNLGQAEGVKFIDPGVPDPPARLAATYDEATDAFTAPPSGLTIPSQTIEDIPTMFGTIDIVTTFSAISDIAGTYEPAAGAGQVTSMDIKANIKVFDSTGTRVGECDISPIPLPLDSTMGSITDTKGTAAPEDDVVYTADNFVPGPGAVVATWTDLPAATTVYDPFNLVCMNVGPLSDGPGGIWLQSAAPTIGPDTCATVQALCPVTPTTGAGNPQTVPGTPTTPAAVRCKKGQKKRGNRCVKKKKKKKKVKKNGH